MAANDVWGGYFDSGTIPPVLTNGVVRTTDSSTSQRSRFVRKIAVKGGDYIEFSVLARAISGMGSIWVDVATEPNLVGHIDVTGHDDWRRYTLRVTIPLVYNDTVAFVGVGIWDTKIGDAEFRLPHLTVNSEHVLPGVAHNGLAMNLAGDVLFNVDGVTRAKLQKTNGALLFNPAGSGFSQDPIADKVEGISFGHNGNGRIKCYTNNSASLLLGRTVPAAVAEFYYVPAGAIVSVGNIAITSTATTYNTSSDYRLKNDVVDLEGSGAFIDALQPRSWSWTTDGSAGAGFVAHELQAISPSSVVGEKDGVNEEGAPAYQAVAYSSSELIANMVAELKLLRQRVAALEANNGV